MGDWDVYRFEGTVGDRVVAEVVARRLNSPLDACVEINDAWGQPIAGNDDYEDPGAGLTTHHADSYVSYVVPKTGVYFLHLHDAQNAGGVDYGYRIRIGPPQPDFQCSIAPSGLNVRAGAPAPITVYALRRDGFSGEISISLQDPPAGFSLENATIPADEDDAQVTLSVPSTAQSGPVTLRLVGRAHIADRDVVRPVVPTDDMTQAFIYHHLVPAREFWVCVLDENEAKQKRGR